MILLSMKTGCCKSCSRYHLGCTIFGSLLSRNIPFNRTEILGRIYEDDVMTRREMDTCSNALKSMDNVTRLIANIDVPGVPDFVKDLFRTKGPGDFMKIWKSLKNPGKIYLEKDLEPYIRKFEESLNPDEDIISDIPDNSGILVSVLTPRIIDFWLFCIGHGKWFLFSTTALITEKPTKQWQIDFIFDLGQNFYLNTADFHIFTHMITGEHSLDTYRLPTKRELAEFTDVPDVYTDCFPISSVLDVAEALSKFSSPTEETRLFENNPPMVGLMSRFPTRLVRTSRKPTTGKVFLNDRDHMIILNGSVMYDESPTKDAKNAHTSFAKVAHALISICKPYNQNEKIDTPTLVIKRTRV